MDYNSALHKLQSINQEHLLNSYYVLPEEEQQSLLTQIEQLQVDIFKKQQELLLKNDSVIRNIEPLTEVVNAADLENDAIGKKLLSEGKVGCLLVAGGQGTRLKCKGPKGTCLVSAVKNKSLFQIFSEKVLAAGKQVNRVLPVAIMTSEENDKETKDFFKKHHYFGLSPEQISFFSQKSLPFLDEKGNLFLEHPYKIAKGPDGNGGSLQQFYESGIWEKWKNQGVSFVHYVLVDNPLENPFDSALLSFCPGKDVVIKCVRRQNPKESVGVLAKENNAVTVVEYSEISEQERYEKDTQGNLKHSFANISLFVFSMDFIRKIALDEKNIPLHKALKNGWKFEKFIFDVLPFAKEVEVVEFARKQCFSPLKNLTGDQSLETVQNDMQELDYEVIKKITGRNNPIVKPFEIAQDFYYPTEELEAKWKGKEIPQKDYIDPERETIS